MKFVNFPNSIKVHIRNEKIGYREYTLCEKVTSKECKEVIREHILFLVKLSDGRTKYGSLCGRCKNISRKLTRARDMQSLYKVTGWI